MSTGCQQTWVLALALPQTRISQSRVTMGQPCPALGLFASLSLRALDLISQVMEGTLKVKGALGLILGSLVETGPNQTLDGTGTERS